MPLSHQQRPPIDVLVTGATGFLGRRICAALDERGDRVIALARHPEQARRLLPFAERILLWVPGMPGEWQSAFDGADAVIHLAGENVGEKRWNAALKRRILESRVEGTRAVAEAIGAARSRPDVLVSASGIGYFGDTGDREVDESAPPGDDFMARVCGAWEGEAMQAAEHGTRTVALRMGVVLSSGKGALSRMAFPFRLFVGGPLGNGRQWFPWIHIDDAVAAFLFAVDTPALSGPVNVVAPDRVTNSAFARALGAALHRPSVMRAPGFALRIILGEFADTILGGQRAVPRKLLEHSFPFRYPTLREALVDLLSKKVAKSHDA